MTATEKQVDLAIEYGANAILTTGDYLLRLVEVARERGYDVGNDLKITALTNMGDRDASRRRSAFRTTGPTVCTRCSGSRRSAPARDGLHVYEDAFVVQIVDPDTGEEVARRADRRDGHHRALQDR